MFTGLVQAIGTVTGAASSADGVRLEVDLGALIPADGIPADAPRPYRIGDSIALSGVCCTVIGLQGAVAAFDLSPETLDRTWLGGAAPGTRLNLEGALRAGDPLGGHLVQGHVDGVGAVTGAIDATAGGDLWARVPAGLRRYCVEKGSITLDGVSLTIAGQREDEVRIAIIPHTAEWTTLGGRAVGEPLHVEVDVIAKYVESMLAARGLGAEV